MAKLISDASDITPWDIGTPPLRFGPKPDSGFADDLQFALDGSHSHRIRAERLEIHAGRELLDHSNRVQNIAEPGLR